MEYLNLYDKSGNLLKEKGIRGQESNFLVGLSIIFIENSKGEFLIQKTPSTKDGLFATTGGHVTYGSDFFETIIKEVNEELGINIKDEEIIEVNTYIKERYIRKVYYMKKDIDIDDLTIQENEVEYVKWLSKDKINELINNNEFREGNIEGYKFILDLKNNMI